ncbi:hypothetical protein Tco_0971711 [Tanacetum coccineum]
MYKINHRRVRNNPEEYFSNHRIVEVFRVTTEQQHRLDYMEQIIMMRENNKPDSFSKDDIKYLNKNDIEDMYFLCMNKKVNYRENKLLNSLMTFIRNKPTTCLIYLNGKEEERVMNLVAIVKFCDATQERVLKEVKLKIFETKILKKAPLLGELYLDIMKAYEREINVRIKRLLDDFRVTAAQMNGNAPPITKLVEGVETIIVYATAKEKAQRRLRSIKQKDPTSGIRACEETLKRRTSFESELLQIKEMADQDNPPPTITAMKIPIIKKGEYDIWSMRMRQYICHTDHNLWDIIVNGDLEDEATPSGE